MDHISRTLTRLLAVAEAELQPDGPVVLLPLQEIVRDILGQGEAEGSEITAALLGIASGRQSLASGSDAATTLLGAVEARHGIQALGDRLSAYGALLDQALALRQLCSTPLLHTAQLAITQPALFRLVSEVRLPAAAGQPDLVVIGAVPRTAPRSLTQLGRHALLDRVQIAYEHADPFPRLSLTTASMSDNAEWAPTRQQWQQRDAAEYDMRLLNSRSRELGRVTTEHATLPFTVPGERLTLTLGEAPDATLMLTTVADAAGTALARCIRVVPHS